MEENIIFIGNKPVMNYVLAIVTQFNDNDKICLKARGRAINRAVDAAEIVRNSFVKEAIISDNHISTEVIEDYEKGPVNVSVIEIFLEK